MRGCWYGNLLGQQNRDLTKDGDMVTIRRQTKQTIIVWANIHKLHTQILIAIIYKRTGSQSQDSPRCSTTCESWGRARAMWVLVGKSRKDDGVLFMDRGIFRY